jgi:hypothetical protein
MRFRRLSPAWVSGFFLILILGHYSVSFFGLDEDGELRPGAWSYQETNTAAVSQVELGSRAPGG